MKKIKLLIPVLLIAFALGALPKSSHAQAEDIVGKVLAVQGTIQFRRGTTPVAQNQAGKVKPVSFTPWEKVKFGQPVLKSDEFKTARASRLKIKFADNSLIALGPNAQMQVQSYLFNSKQKLRQATINVASGLAMYIINKSQKNKKSGFKMVSPLAIIASRGTHGYFAVGTDKVLVANQAGAVASSNADPNVAGTQTVGAMEKTIITEGNPPLPPVPLSNNEVSTIRNLVLGRVGTSTAATGTEKPLIAVEETTEEEQEEEKKADEKKADSKSDSSTDSSDSSADSSDADTKPAKGDKGGDKSTAGPDSSSAGLGGPDSGSADFGIGDLGGFGGPRDFAQVNEPFNAALTSSCSR